MISSFENVLQLREAPPTPAYPRSGNRGFGIGKKEAAQEDDSFSLTQLEHLASEVETQAFSASSVNAAGPTQRLKYQVPFFLC